MENNYVVYAMNYLDEDFGVSLQPTIVYNGIDKATAKSIARAKNKTAPYFISYWAEPENGPATYYPF